MLVVKDWSVHHPLHPERQTIKNVDFHVRRGEVVGIAGLMGAGRTEFAMSLFGRAWGHNISGRVRIDDREVDLSNVTAAIDAGLAYVTEDRKQFGLILADDVRKNIALASLDRVASRGVIDDIRELKAASDYRTRMRIRCSDVYQEAGQSVRRQPAEGCAVEMADDRPQGSDPRRADPRHRRRCEIRDLLYHQRAGGEPARASS